MRKLQVIFLLAIAFLFTNCQKDNNNTTSSELDQKLESALKAASDDVGKTYYTLPAANDLSEIPQDPKNPLTKEKIALGQLLYHETALSINPKKAISKGTYSCSSCHFASAGFQACRVQGISEGGLGFGINGEGREKGGLYQADEIDVQPIRTPSSMNLAYQKNILWNGALGATGVNTGTEALWTAGSPLATNLLGYEGLETQAIAGLKIHRMGFDSSFIQQMYKEMFDQAFPDVDVAKRYDREHAGLAVAAYERSLLPNEAPFQKWLKGDAKAMTLKEKKGAILFFDKAKCASCHNGPALSSMEFYALGMKDLYQQAGVYNAKATDEANLGRASFTKKDTDKYKFKVPQIYNLKETPFYGHGSSFNSIKDVIVYKNKAIAENANVPNSQLAEDFKPLGLSDTEVDELTAFVTHALHDPNLKRYQPATVKSGNCFPFNDPKAKVELGCN